MLRGLGMEMVWSEALGSISVENEIALLQDSWLVFNQINKRCNPVKFTLQINIA